MGVVKYGRGIFGVSTLALHLAYRLRAKRKSLSALSKTKEPVSYDPVARPDTSIGWHAERVARPEALRWAW
jgi:hypothetical protein